jgi:bacillithiol system protein YtxJ
LNSLFLPLTSIENLNLLIESTENKEIFLFKHSERCVISRMAKDRIERNKEKFQDKTIYIVDVIQHRDVSNEIEQKFNIKHESPQLLGIKDKSCFHNSTHNEINPKLMFE